MGAKVVSSTDFRNVLMTAKAVTNFPSGSQRFHSLDQPLKFTFEPSSALVVEDSYNFVEPDPSWRAAPRGKEQWNVNSFLYMTERNDDVLRLLQFMYEASWDASGPASDLHLNRTFEYYNTSSTRAIIPVFFAEDHNRFQSWSFCMKAADARAYAVFGLAMYGEIRAAHRPLIYSDPKWNPASRPDTPWKLENAAQAVASVNDPFPRTGDSTNSPLIDNRGFPIPTVA